MLQYFILMIIPLSKLQLKRLDDSTPASFKDWSHNLEIASKSKYYVQYVLGMNIDIHMFRRTG